MKKSSLFLLPLAAVALTGLGCNPFASVQQKLGEAVTEKVIEGATGGKVDVNSGDNAVTFRDAKTGDYSAWGENAKIPDDFPSDVPRYPGAKTLTVSLKGDKKEAGLSQITSDSLSKVADWFAEQMRNAGFAETSTLDLGASGKVVAYEKGSVKMGVTIAGDEEVKETSLIITRTEE